MSLVALKNVILATVLPNSNNDSDINVNNADSNSNRESSPLAQQPNSYNSTNEISDSDDLENGLIDIQNVSNQNTDILSSKSDNSNHSTQIPFLGSVDPRVMSDLIIGLSDGLTVPFALTAGLSSLGDTRLVITGGMAELVSGAISMGLGGYLAAKSESEYYYSQVRREKQLFFQSEDTVQDQLFDILIDMGASDDTADRFIADLTKSPRDMIDFVIRFGKGLDEPPQGRILTSALTIGSGYFFGGFVPLIPYFFCKTVGRGLLISVITMLITLFWFGYFKSLISMGHECTLWTRVSEGFQMVLIGSIAAGSAWSLVYLIDN